jgi:hypothetical protein
MTAYTASLASLQQQGACQVHVHVAQECAIPSSPHRHAPASPRYRPDDGIEAGLAEDVDDDALARVGLDVALHIAVLSVRVGSRWTGARSALTRRKSRRLGVDLMVSAYCSSTLCRHT